MRKYGMIKTALCFQLTCTTIYMFLVFGGLFFSRNDIHHRSMQKVEPNIVEVEPRGVLSLAVWTDVHVNVILSVILRI